MSFLLLLFEFRQSSLVSNLSTDFSFANPVINSERAAYYAPDFIMKFRMTRKQQLQAVIEEALSSGSGKRSLSLGRKTGSQILKKSASKMRDIMDRSSSSAQEVDISEPSNFRHEGHLDNFSMATFGSVPIMELLKDDIAAGILPAAAFGAPIPEIHWDSIGICQTNRCFPV
jgi:hypothetical protein